MAQSPNPKWPVDGPAPPSTRASGAQSGRILRLALGVVVGLGWIVALEWLFGSVLAVTPNR